MHSGAFLVSREEEVGLGLPLGTPVPTLMTRRLRSIKYHEAPDFWDV